MAVEFIIEDGTGVTDANAYSDLVEARQIAENFGLELPVDDEAAKVSIINGTAFLSRYRYKGNKLKPTQGLPWPRTGGYADCALLPSDSVPKDIKQAAIFAAAYQGELRGASDGREVASEEVDVLKVSYFKNGKSNEVVTIPEVTDRLRDYIVSGNRSVRI